MGNVAFTLGSVFAGLGALLIVIAFFRPTPSSAPRIASPESTIVDLIKDIVDLIATMAKDSFLKVFVPGVILLAVGVGLMVWGAKLNEPSAVKAGASLLR